MARRKGRGTGDSRSCRRAAPRGREGVPPAVGGGGVVDRVQLHCRQYGRGSRIMYSSLVCLQKNGFKQPCLSSLLPSASCAVYARVGPCQSHTWCFESVRNHFFDRRRCWCLWVVPRRAVLWSGAPRCRTHLRRTRRSSWTPRWQRPRRASSSGSSRAACLAAWGAGVANRQRMGRGHSS